MNIVQHLCIALILVICSSSFAQTEEVPEGDSPVVESAPNAETAPSADENQVSQEPIEDSTSAATESVDQDVDPSQDEADQLETADRTEVVIPAAKQSLLKTAANKEFNKPLYFDQLDNGVVLPDLEIDYEMRPDGKAMRLGNAALSERNFHFSLIRLGRAHPQLPQVVDSGASSRFALLMAWPEKLIKNGTLEMISRTGTVLWSYEITDAERAAWAKQLADWKQALIKRGLPSTGLRGGVFATQMGFADVAAIKAPFWGQREAFRFCLTFNEGRNQSKLCSQRYGAQSKGADVVMGKVRSETVAPRVLVQKSEAALKGTVPVKDGEPASFFAELITGESYEFIATPHKLKLMDISDTKNPRVLRVVGYDTRPLSKSIVLNPDQYNKFTLTLGFESTIGDTRKFWAAPIATRRPQLFFPGEGGGVFRQRFELSEIPRAQSRAYLHHRTPKGTYSDGIKLFGRKQPRAQIASSQNSVKADKEDPAEFVWRFQAKERGKINRSYLDIELDGKSYRSYYELYKGYPRELSGRFTAVQTAGTFLILGEVAYNQWFEDLFTWSNYWISRQRWGVSARYFQSFSELNVDTAGNTAPLTVWNADLKYRLAPGLWGRDETVGALLSYQNVTFDLLEAPMLGVGAFWARSMPKVFDDLFNLLPFMQYPKWVDMEFIYYTSSMDSKITLNSSMSLNFHGKVLWSERIFGEAGFGIKRYAFQNASINRRAEFNTFYGTIGMGINF